MRIWRTLLHTAGAWILILGIIAAGSATTVAQDAPNLTGAPVDLHSGTCEDPLTEPAYDGGDLEPRTLNEIEDDEFVDVGLLRDENRGAVGVDLDRDGALAENEIAGGIDEDVPVWVAESDFGEDVDFEQQYVVSVHAGADTYETILACGGIPDEEEDGNRVARLQPVNDSGFFGFSVLEGDGSAIHTYLFQQGQPPAQPAQPAEAGFPVGIHRGDCTEWVTEPAYDVGVMQQTNVALPGEQAPGEQTAEEDDEAAGGVLGEDRVLNEDDEGFLREDIDGDGVFEIGIDRDESGTLEEGEVLGEDANNDEALDESELAFSPAAAAETLGPVYVVDEDTQFDGNELIDEGPYVVAVHESAENYATLVACGPVLPILEDDYVVVPLQPVGDSNLTGVALINQGEGELAGFLWQVQPIQPDVDPTPTPVPTNTPVPPTPTPEPTPTDTPVPPTETPVPTAVIEETEVIVETEVVPAPTATALAAQTPTPTPE